jgi:hypothetical protein
LAGLVGLLDIACGQEPNAVFDWSIKPDKNVYYPGEPVLLTLNIRNRGTQEEEILFGADGIEAFSMESHDSNGIIVAKGDKIQRFGVSRVGDLLVAPSNTAPKSIVLNRWCSTLLSPGQYHVICNVEYRLRSESKKKEGSEVYKAGPFHNIQLGLDIQITEMDKTKFKEMLETLVAFEVKPETQSKREWLAERDLAREKLAFTESELAVPYQLKLLRIDPYTWFGPDTINSLVRSGTPEAASGLVQIIEDPNIHKEDMKHILIDGVYRLRETGKAEIISATDEFVAKYKRPVLLKPMD